MSLAIEGERHLFGTVAGSPNLEDERNGSSFVSPLNIEKNDHVHQVIQQAHEQLLQLLRQRAELMKRIGTLKQTIAGLTNLFGDTVFSGELLDLAGEQKDTSRYPGFTNACRSILLEAARPMSAREVCDKIQEKRPAMLARHKDPMASVTTVLNRLKNYGEAEIVPVSGRRTWRWVAERVPK